MLQDRPKLTNMKLVFILILSTALLVYTATAAVDAPVGFQKIFYDSARNGIGSKWWLHAVSPRLSEQLGTY